MGSVGWCLELCVIIKSLLCVHKRRILISKSIWRKCLLHLLLSLARYDKLRKVVHDSTTEAFMNTATVFITNIRTFTGSHKIRNHIKFFIFACRISIKIHKTKKVKWLFLFRWNSSYCSFRVSHVYYILNIFITKIRIIIHAHGKCSKFTK